MGARNSNAPTPCRADIGAIERDLFWGPKATLLRYAGNCSAHRVFIGLKFPPVSATFPFMESPKIKQHGVNVVFMMGNIG